MKRILIILSVVLLAIQFVPVDRTVPEIDYSQDLFSIKPSTSNVQRIVQSACFDCHSYKTKYPWYSKISPVSVWLQHHVNEGREHVNFSIWGTYSASERLDALEEIDEVLSEGEMPLRSYSIVHADAQLSKSDQKLMIDYFKSFYSNKAVKNQGHHDKSEDHDDDD